MSMSGGPNFGILQPLNQMDPVRSAAPQANAAPMGGGGMLDPYAGQKMQIEQQRLAMEQAQQPGLLANQKLTNQALSLGNTEKQQEITAGQYAIKVRQAAAQAYQDGESKGGPIAGLKASYAKYAEMGDVDTATKGMANVQDLQEKMQAGQTNQVIAAGKAMFGVMSAVKPPQIDPNTKQLIPGTGKNALQVYTEQYPELKKVSPDLPDPKTFKNDQQFEDAYVHPTMEIASDPMKQQAQKQQELNKNALFQANEIVNETQQEFNNAVSKDANSPETKAAAKNLSAALTNRNRVAGGSSPITGNIVSAAKGEDPQSLIDAAQKSSTSSQTSVPSGRILVKSSDGKVGHIPANQLQDAIKAGYSQVQ